MNNFEQTFQQAIEQYKEELLRAYRRNSPPESNPPSEMPAAEQPIAQESSAQEPSDEETAVSSDEPRPAIPTASEEAPATPSMVGLHTKRPQEQPVYTSDPQSIRLQAEEVEEAISPSMLWGSTDDYDNDPEPVASAAAIRLWTEDEMQPLISPAMIRGDREDFNESPTTYETEEEMLTPSMLRDHTLPMEEQPPSLAQPPVEMPQSESVTPYPAPEEFEPEEPEPEKSEPDESMPPEPVLLTQTEPVSIRFPHFVHVQASQRPLSVPTVRTLGQPEEDAPLDSSPVKPAEKLILLPEQPEQPMPASKDLPSPGYQFHVLVTTAHETQPVSGARVIISRPDKAVGALQTDTEVILRVSSTDASGNTPAMELPLAEITPVYIVEVSAPGYATVRQEHTPFYSGLTTTLPVELSPLPRS